MSERWTEYYEGMKAFDRTKHPDHVLPYDLNGVDRARALEWLEGWEAAKREDENDDDASGLAGWPSTTGNPSGDGRQNAE